MRLPLLSQPGRGGSSQTTKRAAPPGVRDRVRVRDVAGHDAGGKKSTTVTVSGEHDGRGVSESEGGDQLETVSSMCTSTNSSIHEVYFLLGDEDSVAHVAERVTATCSAIVSPAVAINYNYTSGSEIEISSESWEVVQWYRGSTFALGYNSTSTSSPTPALDSPFFTCLNTTISTTLPHLPLLPLLPNPIILKSHSGGWHPNGSSKGGEIIVICFLSILFGPFALLLLAIVLLGIVAAIFWCLEMCCTCCGLVSCSDVAGETVETPKPQPKPLVTTPPKRTSAMAMAMALEKGGSQARDSSYAGNSLRFPPNAHTHRGALAATQDWDTFRLLTGSHYHYDESIMARAYNASQISRSNNNDNIQIMPPQRLSLSEAKSVLVTRTSTRATVTSPTVLAEGDKNPFVDSDSVDSVADSIGEAPPSL